jgi:hypothetical protein
MLQILNELIDMVESLKKMKQVLFLMMPLVSL